MSSVHDETSAGLLLYQAYQKRQHYSAPLVRRWLAAPPKNPGTTALGLSGLELRPWALLYTADRLKAAFTPGYMLPDTSCIHLYPLDAVNMCLVSATKLLLVCRPTIIIIIIIIKTYIIMVALSQNYMLQDHLTVSSHAITN